MINQDIKPITEEWITKQAEYKEQLKKQKNRKINRKYR